MSQETESGLSILEAIETLSSIAGMENDKETYYIETRGRITLNGESVDLRKIDWLRNPSMRESLIKKTFLAILAYLKECKFEQKGSSTDLKLTENIQVIMALVSEVAKKMDQLALQSAKVSQFKEYELLQNYYKKKIEPKIPLNNTVSSQWVLGLTLKKETAKKTVDFHAFPRPVFDEYKEVKHVYIDLDSVKRDVEYELFFIRKEDGSHFYHSKLLRSMKMVSDFRHYFQKKQEYLPFESETFWLDKIYYHAAKNIFNVFGKGIDRFFQVMRGSKEGKLAPLLDKALFALMLSANERNLRIHKPIKCCSDYFLDFQKFFRAFLQTPICHHWMSMNPQEMNEEVYEIVYVVQTICKTMYLNLKGFCDMLPVVQDLMKQAIAFAPREYEETFGSGEKLKNRLLAESAAMQKFLLRNGRGPLVKLFETLNRDSYSSFDPLMEQNLPSHLFDLAVNDQKIALVHMPCPTRMEVIHKAEVVEEFKSALIGMKTGAVLNKHLLINLQDRTSWREHARCRALEELASDPSFESVIDVVTLTVDTDFYNQIGPYRSIHGAHTFKAQFKEVLLDENTGYFFPKSVQRDQLATFIDHSFKAIHQLFFSFKNVLTRENRLNFIDIFYTLLQLKLIEWLKPTTVSLTCKDGIDKGGVSCALLFSLLKFMHSEEWNEADWSHLNGLLYGFSLFVRERAPLYDRFHRMVDVFGMIENKRDEDQKAFIEEAKKELGALFNTDILFASIQKLPHTK